MDIDTLRDKLGINLAAAESSQGSLFGDIT